MGVKKPLITTTHSSVTTVGDVTISDLHFDIIQNTVDTWTITPAWRITPNGNAISHFEVVRTPPRATDLDGVVQQLRQDLGRQL